MLGDPGAKREVLFGASTGEGLGQLAESAGAPARRLRLGLSDCARVTRSRVRPPQHLLDGGAVSVAVAVAGLRTRLNEPIKLDRSARRRAQERGRTADGGRTCGEARCEARGVARRAVDLILVGSQPDAPAGRVVVGGDVRAELDRARSSVLVVPAGAPLLP